MCHAVRDNYTVRNMLMYGYRIKRQFSIGHLLDSMAQAPTEQLTNTNEL